MGYGTDAGAARAGAPAAPGTAGPRTSGAGAGATRRALLAAALALPAAPAAAQAPAAPATAPAAPQPGAWPDRPVRIIASYPPGGAVDVPARLVAAALQPLLGQPVVVENRAGANGSIGAAAAAQAPADGHTLLADASGQAVNQALMTGLPFDYARAFAPLGLVSISPLLLVVRAESPLGSLSELLAASRAPGGLAYASSGAGNGTHLAAVQLARRAGLTLTHAAYRGSTPAMQGLLAGDVAFAFSTLPQAGPLVRDGKLRALAATTAAARLPGFEAVPTVAEQGFPGFEAIDWVALWAPAATPAPVLARLEAALREAQASAPVAEGLRRLGVLPAAEPGAAALAAFIARQRESLGTVVRAEGIRLE